MLKSAALILALCAPLPALAEGAPQPDRSSETFEQWTVQCETAPATTPEAKAAKLCEMVQAYTNNRTGNEVARLAFAPDEKGALTLILRSVADLSFASPPQVTIGADQTVAGTWLRCRDQFCYARFDITADQIAALGNASEASVQFALSNDQVLRIAVGTKGAKAALAALNTKKN